MGDAVPTPDEVYKLTMGTVLRAYHEFKKTYTKGMEEMYPKAYVCEEIIDKNGEGGKRTLTKDVDDEDRVKDSALTAATAEGVREHTTNEVWEQVEPDVHEKTSVISISFLRKRANEAARASTDKLVDAAIDKVRDNLAELLAKGQDLPPPPPKKEPKKKGQPEEKKTVAKEEPSKEEPSETEHAHVEEQMEEARARAVKAS